MILDRLFGIDSGERAMIAVAGASVQQDATLKRVFGLQANTGAGVPVDEDTALNFSAVYAAVRLLSSIPGALPKFVYKRINDGGDKEIDRTNPVAKILHDRPNPVHTPIQYEEITRSLVLLWGRSVSYIERDGKGTPIALWPMHTKQVYRSWSQRRPVYDVRHVSDCELFPKPPFSGVMLDDSQVLDVGAIDGKSIISRAREQIGEGLAAQAFGAGFYGGGAQPYLALKHPGTLTSGAQEKLRENWQRRHGDQTRRIAVLEENMDVKEIGMPLDDAQFLESRKFYVTEIARWFGVPPHKLADLERATFSNIEEQQLEFYEGLIPWFARFVQEYHYKLFTESERETYLVDYMVEGLLKGNLAQRYAAYSTALQWGFMNRNEVRRKENLNSMGEDGDVFLVPVNMQPADAVEEDDQAEGTTDTTDAMGTAADPPDTEQVVQTDPAITLNGLQIQSATAIVQAVADGLLPRDSGLGQLQVLLNLSAAQAETIMGTVGNGFEPKAQPAKASPAPPEPKPMPAKNPDAMPAEGDMPMMAARAIVYQAVKRAIEKEAAEIAIAARNPAGFIDRAERFYKAWPDKAAAGIRAALTAVHSSHDPAPYLKTHCERAMESLLEWCGVCSPTDLPAAIKGHTDDWRRELPDQITTILLGDQHGT